MQSQKQILFAMWVRTRTKRHQPQGQHGRLYTCNTQQFEKQNFRHSSKRISLWTPRFRKIRSLGFVNQPNPGSIYEEYDHTDTKINLYRLTHHLNESKCQFFYRKIKYPGHIMSSESQEVEACKTDTLKT